MRVGTNYRICSTGVFGDRLSYFRKRLEAWNMGKNRTRAGTRGWEYAKIYIPNIRRVLHMSRMVLIGVAIRTAI